MKAENSSNFYLGTVTEVSENGVKIQLDGHSDALEKYYKQLNTGSLLSVDDRVVIMKLNGSYIVMGKISYDNSDVSEKVSKTGDTMTGSLVIDGADINLDSEDFEVGTPPASNTNDRHIYFRDKVKSIFGRIQSVFMSDSRVGLQMVAERTVSGSLVQNILEVSVDSNGERKVAVNSSPAWLSALGLGTNGALPITIAQGGSGQTGSGKTTTIAQIATAGTNINITSATFYQWGKLAMLEINGTATATVSGGSVIFTLVSGKRPALDSSAQVWLSTSNTSIVKPNGEITLAGSGLSSGAGVTIMACYLLP